MSLFFSTVVTTWTMFELEIGQAPAYLTVSATANIYSKEAIQIQYKSVCISRMIEMTYRNYMQNSNQLN